MIQLLICEKRTEYLQNIREILHQLSIEIGENFDIYWLYGKNIKSELENRIGDANIVLISMNLPDALQIALAAHKENSLCRLLIFDGKAEELPVWIPTGAVAFCPSYKENFKKELSRLVKELQEDKNIFCFQTKREKRYIPYSQIMYFCSDLRYIDVVTSLGNTYRFISKLDKLMLEVQKNIFIRIHKSYIVNVKYIYGIDCATHEIILFDGRRLPCSTKYYQNACIQINNFKQKI